MKSWLIRISEQIILKGYEKITPPKIAGMVTVMGIMFAICWWLRGVIHFNVPIFFSRIDAFELLFYFPIIETMGFFVWIVIFLSIIVKDYRDIGEKSYSNTESILLTVAGALFISVLFHEYRGNTIQLLLLTVFVFLTNIAGASIVLSRNKNVVHAAFWIYVLVVSLIFSAMHYYFIMQWGYYIIGYLFFSVITIYLIIKTRGIFWPIVFHSFANTMYFILRNFN